AHEDYMRAAKYYFDCIIGPFKPYMRKALERVRQLDVSMICTGHGPVLDTDIDFMMNTYEKWCTVINPNKEKTVVMPYVSAYGYTREIGQEIARGIKESGDIKVLMFDMVESNEEEVLEAIGFADGLLFGTPTIVGEALKPIWNLTTSMFAGTHGGKLASAYGSYGWSGEGVPHILERLKQLHMKVTEGFKVRFRPSDAQLVDAYEYGFDFGCRLLEKENPKKEKKGARSLVKCLVCGEIFDSSLEICPVCGVGRENFVPVEVEESSYREDSQEFYVILGNGAAGFYAAKAIRERDKTGSVVMVSNEEYPTYNRPMLTKSIMAGLNPQEIGVEPVSWYEENKVYQVLGKTVDQVDTAEREIVLSDGARLKYTKLIYALGAECFIPPMEGKEKPEVIAIRRLADTQKIASLLPKIKEAVVIGGGVLGLEAAWELHKSKCKVTVLEAAPRIMGRQLDTGASEMLMEISKANGIEIQTAVKIAGIEGEDHVTGVRLEDGTVLPAQLVVVSCGVRANTAVAKGMGLNVNRGVVVNGNMETSMEDVYACGDCAEFDGINYAIWPQAVEEGKTAGANAAGEALIYQTVPAALSFHGMNTALYAIGDNGSNSNLLYKTAEFKDRGKKQYEKYYFLNNRLCGAILLGDTSKMAKVTEAMEKGASFPDMFS
ncbi:MAG: FAD-dependent oxidoreductase, partial [Blautia sp.]